MRDYVEPVYDTVEALGPARAAEALAERAGRLAVLMDEDHRRLDEALADEIADGQLAWPPSASTRT